MRNYEMVYSHIEPYLMGLIIPHIKANEELWHEDLIFDIFGNIKLKIIISIGNAVYSKENPSDGRKSLSQHRYVLTLEINGITRSIARKRIHYLIEAANEEHEIPHCEMEDGYDNIHDLLVGVHDWVKDMIKP